MKDIRNYLVNFLVASAGFSLGRLKDDPGDGSGSGVVVATHNDFLYAFYAPIIKYLGAVSDTDESESASDFTNALERIAQTVGASAHIASYDYLDKSYILRDGIIWRANADIDTGVDGTDFISQYNAGKWDSQVLSTDREQIFGGSIKINTVDVLNDVDFGATVCFDQISGDIISASTFTKQMDNTFTAGDNQGMLDTGTVAANSLYYLYEIKKDSDSSGDYLASLSASSPTMPAGYTMKRIIGTLPTKTAAAEIESVAESINRINIDIASIGLIRIQNNEILYNAENESGTYKYLSTGKAYRTDLSTNKRYEVASGTAGATISSWAVLSSGEISGSLLFNTTSVPPKVSSGTRNILGKDIQAIADVSLTTSDVLGVCSQAFGDYAYSWMFQTLDENGNHKYIPAVDNETTVGSLSGIAVTSISVAAGVATVATGNTTALAVGHLAVIIGSDIGAPLIGKVTGVVAGVSFTTKTTAGDGAYSAGTYDAYYRIATYHGTGVLAGVNVDADILKFSPSPLFNKELNGYYLDQYGKSTSIVADAVYRILGSFGIDASGDVNAEDIISYKSGNDKNDNLIQALGAISKTGTPSTFYRYTIPDDFYRFRGDDYIATDDGTDKFKITFNRNIDVDLQVVSDLVTQAGVSSACRTHIFKNGGNTNISHTIGGASISTKIPLRYLDTAEKSSYVQIQDGAETFGGEIQKIQALQARFKL